MSISVNTDTNVSELIRARIIHVLHVYPGISQSMLQIGLGTAFPTDLWKPILNALIAENTIKRIVVQHVTPTNRNQSYAKLFIATTEPSYTTTTTTTTTADEIGADSVDSAE